MNELSESDKRRVGDQGFDLSAAEITPEQVRAGRLKRRREKIVAEIERNRRGDYTVPTWALTALLVAFIVGFAALIILVGN